MEYTYYKGLYYKFELNGDMPIWKVSEDREGMLLHTWGFNATIYSLNACYMEIENDRDFQYYLKHKSPVNKFEQIEIEY